jgi:MarR family transcriptional regulator, transcriptional regulator for hemolysin
MGNPHDQGLFQHESGTNYFHLLREVLLTYRQMLRQLAAETGLSGAQFEALRELALAGGRSTVSAMARELGVDPAAVSRLVAGLERAGLVERVQDERDGRSQPVVLSDAGRRLMLAFHTEAHEREGALGGLLDSESVETAMRVLRTIRDALGAMSHPPSRTQSRGDTVEGGQS